MIDQKKRSTLKSIGLVTAAAAIPSQALLASNRFEDEITTTSASSKGLGMSDLKIEILTSHTVKHNTVILSNLSDQSLAIKHFKPGSVIWGDQYLDLNGLRGHVGLTLAAGSTISLSVLRQTINYSFQSEYIWADDAITPHNKNTNRVLLGAFLANGQLHAYPIPTISQFA